MLCENDVALKFQTCYLSVASYSLSYNQELSCSSPKSSGITSANLQATPSAPLVDLAKVSCCSEN